MKTTRFEDRETWLAARLGKITGSRAKDIAPMKRGTGKKIGFYELIAERIGLPADGENPMDRGNRLEEEAMERFVEATGKDVDTSLVLWSADDEESIAVSPDGVVGETEAVEVKCLSSARHIEALLTKVIPDEYEYQVLQYFLVNDKLQKLFFCLYDPRLKFKDFFFLEVTRESQLARIEEMRIHERETLREVEQIVKELSAF